MTNFYDVAKFWMIKLYLDISAEYTHTNEYKEHANCGLQENFWKFLFMPICKCIFCSCHFELGRGHETVLHNALLNPVIKPVQLDFLVTKGWCANVLIYYKFGISLSKNIQILTQKQ